LLKREFLEIHTGSGEDFAHFIPIRRRTWSSSFAPPGLRVLD